MINIKPAVIGGPLWLINFYTETLPSPMETLLENSMKEFNEGLGKETNHGVVVTNTLIQATIRRLLELEAKQMIGMPVGENYYAPRR